MKTVAIIQARMGSTRLPGKVLMPLCGKSVLAHTIDRVKSCSLITQTVVATTTLSRDQAIIEESKKLGIDVFEGSEDDVLSRYYHAASAFYADIVIRITSDCPLIDPKVIEKTVRCFLDGQYDYVSDVLTRSYPRGMDTEVFSFNALSEAFYEAVESHEREHVTPFIYRQPHRYRLGNVSFHEDQSRHRWTLDTPEDYDLICRITELLYPKNPMFTLEDILVLFEKYPDLFLINAHISQKEFR
ncbi:MAG: acylneuraminate cytidylyltransferase [Desulfobacteraceae bacterium IS3]|nr:MAG: acylneuraminate cytidylyltransferase [Desulfobacteraceae bacterium IS3]